MSLQVYIAHSGACLQVDRRELTSIEELQRWVADQTGIDVNDQLLLTGQGKAPKAQSLNSETEIFIFDSRALTASSPDAPAMKDYQVAIPEPYIPEQAPDTVNNPNDLRAWRDLLQSRTEWAHEVYENCEAMANDATDLYGEINVIIRAIHATILNLNVHTSSLEKKFDGPKQSVKKWAEDIIAQYDGQLQNLDKSFSILKDLPVSAVVLRFMDKRYTGNDDDDATLGDLLVEEEVFDAHRISSGTLVRLKDNFQDLTKNMKKLRSGMGAVVKREGNITGTFRDIQSDEPQHHLQDIKALVTKLDNDYSTLVGYPNEQKSISQASKTTLLHTRQFLPSLMNCCEEMYQLLVSAIKLRNEALAEQTDILRGVGTLNALIASCNNMLGSINLGEDETAHQAVDLIQFVDRLPILYASLIAESIRRRNWSEKMKSDSQVLVNEMAEFQEEETKRRKKWQTNIGHFFWKDRHDCKAPGLEINLLGEDSNWPETSRQDIVDFIDALHNIGALPGVISEVTRILQELNTPIKQQAKRARAFKNGSYHEAVLGKSALLVRGDDDMLRSLQDDKSKLAARLKGSESRVRKLESLLHNQSQSTRAISGTGGSTFPSPDDEPNNFVGGSPLLRGEEYSRPSSAASRRFSGNKTMDEKAVTQRIIHLESELLAERERGAGLEKEASAKTTQMRELKMELDEAHNMKRDLMRNLEAQQREFALERKALEDNQRRLRDELEGYEDGMDRVMGSRENERTTLDMEILKLKEDLEKATAHADTETAKAQGQVDFLRNEAQLQRETNSMLEKQQAMMRSEIRILKKSSEDAGDSLGQSLAALHGLHSILYPDETASEQIPELADALWNRVKELIRNADLHERDLAVAQADRDKTEDQLVQVQEKLLFVDKKLRKEEDETIRLRELLDEEKARFDAIESDRTERLEQLADLRKKFAEGETGSEALRTRLEEEERKVTSLTEELAKIRSQCHSQHDEVKSLQERLQCSGAEVEHLRITLSRRTARAKDLTQRLYAQVDRNLRLLERFNYSVTSENGSMIVTKIPRSERQNQSKDDSDPSSSMRRSVSGLGKKSMLDSGELEFLYWMANEDAEKENSQWEAFVKAMDGFDVEVFCETIAKQLKVTDHNARRVAKEGRMFRERYYAVQKEASEKIAYKHFKEGDLALFLPTRGQSSGAWAAFNVGAPHYFLKEQDSHRLSTRDFLLARIQKIEDRVAGQGLSKSLHSNTGERGSIDESSLVSLEDDNPFALSEGLKWHMLDAVEEKIGAPNLMERGKSTVSATTVNVEAKASIRHTKTPSAVDNISKTLNKSLESRRSSNNSVKGSPLPFMRGKRPDSVVIDESGVEDAPRSTIAGRGESRLSMRLDATDMTPTQSQQQHTQEIARGPVLLSTSTSGLEREAAAIESLARRREQKSNGSGAGGGEAGSSTGTSPQKKSMIWDSLWKLDVSIDRGRK